MTDEELFGTLVLAALIGLIPAVIAKNKGHNFFLWWLFGFVVFIIALPGALLISKNKKVLEAQKLDDGFKKCPYCAELIKEEAIICKHCGRNLMPKTSEVYEKNYDQEVIEDNKG